MDKHQKFLLNDFNVEVRSLTYHKKDPHARPLSLATTIDSGPLLIKQDEDYNSTEYEIRIYCGLAIASTAAMKGGQKIADGVFVNDDEMRGYRIPVSFKNKPDSIVFTFYEGFADPLTFPLAYEEVAEDSFDAKTAEAKKEEFAQKLDFQAKTGESLVNLYWNNVNEEVSKSHLDLYVEINRTKRLIGKYDEDKGVCFKSITGLAYGSYACALSQYDVSGNLLTKKEISFVIRSNEYVICN